MNKSALLVIDVQHGLLDQEPRPFEADAVVGRINRLAAAARRAACPVVFIQHERPGSPLEHGSDFWQLAHGLVLEPTDHLLRKTTPDSFMHTPLEALLREHGIDHVVVTGYACEFCVDTTARRAAGLGFAVTLAADAHTTHDKPHASAAQIRDHENATLPGMVSFARPITAAPSAEIRFGG